MSAKGSGIVELERAKKIVSALNAKGSNLIQILLEVQREYGYFPSEAIDIVSDTTGIPPVRIFGILTFYSQFKMTPPAQHNIRVCQGTACHVMGGERIVDFLVDRLGVSIGETTGDGCFSFEGVACLGCCGMAPAVTMDGKVHGRSSVKKVEGMLDDLTKVGGK